MVCHLRRKPYYSITMGSIECSHFLLQWTIDYPNLVDQNKLSASHVWRMFIWFNCSTPTSLSNIVHDNIFAVYYTNLDFKCGAWSFDRINTGTYIDTSTMHAPPVAVVVGCLKQILYNFVFVFVSIYGS